MSVISLVAIVGPTASGKTGAAIELAEKYNGEIICADSRTVYKHLDVGTAKPTAEEQKRIKHHCIDLVEIGEPFTVADFQRHAREAIQDIRARGKLPLIVGGTGLYVDAVVYNFSLLPVDDVARIKYQTMSKQQLIYEVRLQFSKDDATIVLERAQNNERRLVRALEHKSITQIRESFPPSTVYMGINPPKEMLESRIRARLATMISQGVVEEATRSLKMYDEGKHSSTENGQIDTRDVRFLPEALTGNIYSALHPYILGECSLEEALEVFVHKDLRLAKRQMTWFKRNPDIVWCASADELVRSFQALS